MTGGSCRWRAALLYAAVLLLAVLTASRHTALHTAAGPAERPVVQVATAAEDVVAQPPLKAGHPAAKPVKRLPWTPAEPVRWSAFVLVVLTGIAFGTVTLARRAWRWHAFALRAPPVSALA